MVGTGNASKIPLVSMLAEVNGMRSKRKDMKVENTKGSTVVCPWPLRAVIDSAYWFFFCGLGGGSSFEIPLNPYI